MVAIDLSAKAIASLAAGLSSSVVVRSIIANNVNPVTPFEKAEIWIGSFAIGGAISEAIQARTRRRLDEIETIYNEFKAEQAKHQ